MTASISVPAPAAGRIRSDRFAGFGPLFRKELLEWGHSKRLWVILVVTTLFMTLTAANAAINSWAIANIPGAEVPNGAISLDPTTNFLMAISTQIFVFVAIFAIMGLLVAERDRGTLAWVASKPVSRGAIVLSKWAAAAIVVTIATGVVPMAATFGLVAVLYGSAGIGAFVFAAIGAAALIALMVAVVLAASTVISNQSAVAAIGFAVLFLPQLLAGFLPFDVTPFLPTSILVWAMGPVLGAEMGFVTPIAWAVSIIALVGFASWRMDRMEF
jgi:ABC-2 type transport system permease protein